MEAGPRAIQRSTRSHSTCICHCLLHSRSRRNAGRWFSSRRTRRAPCNSSHPPCKRNRRCRPGSKRRESDRCMRALSPFSHLYSPRSPKALKEYSPDEAKVLRVGQTVRVHASELVPGDIIFVSIGDKIPADCGLLSISSSSFRVDQAILTGESESVRKTTDVVPDMKAVKQDMTNILFSVRPPLSVLVNLFTLCHPGDYCC